MPKVSVYNVEGKKVSDIDLKEEIFGIEPNEAIIHSVLVNFLANQRQGTQSTKTRAEVRGGGRKPRILPCLALPVPFCLHGFLPPPRTSALVFVL